MNVPALAARVVLAMLRWAGRRARGSGAARSAGATALKRGKVLILDDPARQFTPNNPKWLKQGAGWAPDAVPPEYLHEPPALAQFKAAAAAGELEGLEFGSQAARELFCLEPTTTYLNHGSYGATYKLALEVQAWYRQQLEHEPVRFMETEGLASLVRAVAEVAGFIGADARDVVPVTNATTGVNAVLHSLALSQRDLVLVTNATYPAVRSAVASAAVAAGAGLLDLQLELSDMQDEAALVAAFRAALAAARGRRIKLAVLDLVVSFPPVVMPVQRLCALLRDAGVPVLVDGAHAIGALHDLCVPQLGCQFFVSTLHKWLCTPKGAAMLWVHPSQQHAVHPCVVSHGYGLGYRAEFLWQGTADFSAWLAAPSCIALQRALTTSRITAYNHGLVKRAAAMLAAAWGTGQVVGVAADGVTAGLVAVRMPWPLAMPSTSSSRHSRHSSAAADEQLPLAAVRVNSAQQQADADKAAAAADGSPAPPTPDDAAALNLLLRRQHRIEVPVAAVAGLLWCRISAQVYNSMADYERLRDVVLGLKQRC